jgi:hypothetical protein
MAGLLCAAGCGMVVRPTRGYGDADRTVQDFCRKFGRQKGLGILSLFADSARFDLEGLGVSFVGREGLARLADYGVAARSRLVPREFDVRQDTIRCRLEETNDWLGLLGVKRASYNGRFLVAGTRIMDARISLTPESKDEMGGRLAGFVVWLSTEDPKALQRLFPGGRPAYDGGVVPELIARLRQWRSR